MIDNNAAINYYNAAIKIIIIIYTFYDD